MFFWNIVDAIEWWYAKWLFIEGQSVQYLIRSIEYTTPQVKTKYKLGIQGAPFQIKLFVLMLFQNSKHELGIMNMEMATI